MGPWTDCPRNEPDAAEPQIQVGNHMRIFHAWYEVILPVRTGRKNTNRPTDTTMAMAAIGASRRKRASPSPIWDRSLIAYASARTMNGMAGGRQKREWGRGGG